MHKLLSNNDTEYKDAPTEGIRRILEAASGLPFLRDAPLDTARIESVRMATTVATNALLERRGHSFALLITKGFKDLLKIGNQSRPNIFDLKITMPDVLYSTVLEVNERVTISSNSVRAQRDVSSAPNDDIPASSAVGVSGEPLHILLPLQLESLRNDLKKLHDTGIQSLAVVLLHATLYPAHELEIARLASELGFTNIVLSHQVSSMVKCVQRGLSTCVNAYLSPCLEQYVQRFIEGFQPGIKNKLLFMQSDGGLIVGFIHAV